MYAITQWKFRRNVFSENRQEKAGKENKKDGEKNNVAADQMTFKRYEIKYMLTPRQEEQIKKVMVPYMKEDEHGRSTILSLYFDTPDYLLIRRSMDHPVYKEKLRLRSYGVAKKNTTVFLELKKKYDSVVYKRRISMPLSEAEQFLTNEKEAMTREMQGVGKLQRPETDRQQSGTSETVRKKDPSVKEGLPGNNVQIRNEIQYCIQSYCDLHPAVFLTYERDAFYGKNDREFRITFDHNILWRDHDLSLSAGICGAPILKEDQVLMEVKTAGAMPLWMTHYLTENRLYKTSFSKYATAYRTMHNLNQSFAKK